MTYKYELEYSGKFLYVISLYRTGTHSALFR